MSFKITIYDENGEALRMLRDRLSSNREKMIDELRNEIMARLIDEIRSEGARVASIAVDELLGNLPRPTPKEE